VQAGAYYYFEKTYSLPSRDVCSTTNSLTNSSTHITVDTLINYGNGTSRWFNRTNVPSNWNFYTLTTVLADNNVEAQFYGPPTCEHFVSGIDGVRNNGQSYWTLWVVCPNDNAWTVPAVGADLLSLTTYRAFSWYYQSIHSQDQSTWNPPVTGAKKLGLCS
jgi:hypothetical protein